MIFFGSLCSMCIVLAVLCAWSWYWWATLDDDMPIEDYAVISDQNGGFDPRYSTRLLGTPSERLCSVAVRAGERAVVPTGCDVQRLNTFALVDCYYYGMPDMTHCISCEENGTFTVYGVDRDCRRAYRQSSYLQHPRDWWRFDECLRYKELGCSVVMPIPMERR